MIFTTRELGVPPGLQGMIFAVGGLASLAGAVLVGPASRRFGSGRAMIGGVLAMGCSLLLVPLARPPLAMAVAILILQQLGDGAFAVYAINEKSLRQVITPAPVLGRANATVRFSVLSAMLIASLVGGWLGGLIGVRATLLLAAVGVLASAAWLAASPVRSLRSGHSQIDHGLKTPQSTVNHLRRRSGYTALGMTIRMGDGSQYNGAEPQTVTAGLPVIPPCLERRAGVGVAVHTVVLGAGPGGLAASYQLARAGLKLVVLEREAFAGGMTRTIKHNGFYLDIGRKELYSRNPAVHQFLTEILGGYYRTYPRRFASLYRGHIIEQSSAYKGLMRGMPLGMFVRVVADAVVSRVRYSFVKPRTYAEWVYAGTGRLYSQLTEQAYWEKIHGKRWNEMPAPVGDGAPSLRRLDGITDHRSGAHGAAVPVAEWRHPARGAGQIIELLERGAEEAGARFEFQSTITSLEADERRVTAVTVRTATESLRLLPEHVVSSIPIQGLTKLLLPQFKPSYGSGGPPPKRSARLVYLFFSEPPRFPHAWLEVSSPDLRVGRVTNFVGFNGEMVPTGQACLCVEYFCTEGDGLLEMSDDALRDLALKEMGSAGLVDPSTCFDSLVLTLPGGDAAINLRAWTAATQPYLDALRPFENLYYINRPSTDQALFAGLLAADAIISGSRTTFDSTPWG